ncbi:MAG TPA: PHB depolymerase family esterase [Rhizomicrobium sp.]|nr:PHB depolymerase family esterase [Rhizomicrobium sp.]
MGKGYSRALLCGALVASLVSLPAAAGTLSTDVVFTDTTPLSSNLELARRLLSPLTEAQLPALVAKSGKALAEQPIDLAQEKFVVFVPATKPAAGYGLLVFVPPWDAQKVPEEWNDVLDAAGIIFVAAANSGNDANPIGRREPLALLAYANIAKRYPVDPARVYVGGFSGGSRIAMRLALGYPDVFRGALLNSGSDPIGDRIIPIPPRDLFARFQESSRLAYVTGADDTTVLQADRASRHAMSDWCVFNVEDREMRGTGHHSADSSSFSWALDSLAKPASSDSAALAQCRAGIDAALAEKNRALDALVADGKQDAARALLTEIDQHYGGLAAPHSVDLATRLAR